MAEETTETKKYNPLLSRKFILSMLVVIAASGLVYFKSISDTNYMTIVGTVVAVYIGGNVTQKATAK